MFFILLLILDQKIKQILSIGQTANTALIFTENQPQWITIIKTEAIYSIDLFQFILKDCTHLLNLHHILLMLHNLNTYTALFISV